MQANKLLKKHNVSIILHFITLVLHSTKANRVPLVENQRPRMEAHPLHMFFKTGFKDQRHLVRIIYWCWA